MLQSLDLVDIDGGADEATSVVLTDHLGRMRVYAVPPGWTGDRLLGQPGILTLDLTTLAPQPGFASSATPSRAPASGRTRSYASTCTSAAPVRSTASSGARPDPP